MATAGVLPKDRNFFTAIGGTSSATDTAASIRPFQYDATTRGMTVHIVGNDVSAGDGAILDGVTAAIKATVLDYAASNPLAVRLTDTGGDYVAAGAGTQYTEDAAAAANPVGGTLILVREDARAGSLTTTDGDNVAARGTNAGELYVKHVDSVAVTGTFWQATQPVSLASVPSHAVTNAGTFAVQVDGAALTSLQLIDDAIYATDGALNKSMVMGAVFDDVSPVAITENQGGYLRMSSRRALLVEGVASGTAINVLDTNSAAALTSLQLIDNAISGAGFNITQFNGEAIDVGAGTEAAALRVTLPTDGTGQVKTKTIPSDIDINGSNANHADKYYTNAGAVTDGIIWSPAAGKRWHVLTLYINVSAAATVTIEDDLAGGDVARWKGELAANSGVVLTYDKEHPFSSGEDAADLLITTSAGNCYVQCVGYEV